MVENPNFQITGKEQVETTIPNTIINGGAERNMKPVDPFINWDNKFMRVEKPGETLDMPKIPY